MTVWSYVLLGIMVIAAVVILAEERARDADDCESWID